MRRTQGKKTHSPARPRRVHRHQGSSSSYHRTERTRHSGPERYWVLSFTRGLEPFVREQLHRHQCELLSTPRTDEEITCRGGEPLGRALQSIRTATALFRAITLPVERPRGITSYEYDGVLRSLFEEVFRLTSLRRFTALRLEGAGKHTPTFQRLGDHFARMTTLPYRPVDEEADLVIRLRRSTITSGWEVLVRTTPRPLATRDWRVKNMRGAISGPLAAAIIQLARPAADETVLNLPCGSGTILAELLEIAPVHRAIGLDIAPETLDAAWQNLTKWRNRSTLQLLQGDLQHLPLADNAASLILSDPPWGEALSTRTTAARLNRDMLGEMYRVLSPDGRLIVITQHYRALEQAAAPLFERERVLHVFQGGFHPHIIVFQKKRDRG